MEQRRLGRSDMYVSTLCLGAMTWGEKNNEAEGFAQMDPPWLQASTSLTPPKCMPPPPAEKTYGTTGTIIGDWFRTRPSQHVKAVLTSKVAGCSAPPDSAVRIYRRSG